MIPCAVAEKFSAFFGSRPVLSEISLSFSEKSVTALLGRSGSGKTTLLRSLNGLNDHFAGFRSTGDLSVRLGGILRPVRGPDALPASELRRRVGMVFQNPNPLPLSIRRNMTLPLSLVAGTEGEEAEGVMREAFVKVGLWPEVSHRLDRPTAELSGGQQQRLCLARAVALKPEILLLDEPTASLDYLAAAGVEELILSLKEQYSIIMVSHSFAQARRVADTLVFLSDGRVSAALPVSDVPLGADIGPFLERYL